MRQAFSLMMICATAFLVSCTADDLDRGFEEIGAGIIVTQDSGDGTVAFYWVDPADKTELRYRYAVANPPSVSGDPYGTRISPDLLGEYTLIFDGVPNEAPQIHLLRTRDGFAQARLSQSFPGQVYDALAETFDRDTGYVEDIISRYELIDVWWMHERVFIVQVSLESRSGGRLNDLLLRYELDDISSDGVPQVSDFLFIDPDLALNNPPDGFQRRRHRYHAGPRLTLDQGSVRIDGQATTGGPQNAVAANGFIAIQH
jgi:hypothetical protein